jgi:hypothetical protein
MLTVDTVAKVRLAHFIDGKNIKRTVREQHLSRATCEASFAPIRTP